MFHELISTCSSSICHRCVLHNVKLIWIESDSLCLREDNHGGKNEPTTSYKMIIATSLFALGAVSCCIGYTLSPRNCEQTKKTGYFVKKNSSLPICVCAIQFKLEHTSKLQFKKHFFARNAVRGIAFETRWKLFGKCEPVIMNYTLDQMKSNRSKATWKRFQARARMFNLHFLNQDE